MTPEEIADRFDSRPGYKLVAYGPVGLPVYRLTTVGVTLARKTLSPIEEFILRGIAAGVESVGEIAGLLGLDTSVIEASLSELIRTDLVVVSPGTATAQRSISLTGKGKDIASDQEVVVPMEQTIVFSVDGLTRKPRFYPNESLYKPSELRDLGIPEVRAFPSRPPELDEFDIKDVVKIVKLDAGRDDSPRQLLRINSIERRDRLFLEAVALVYRAETGGAFQAAFAIDGRLSVEHEQAFSRAQGLDKTKLFRGLMDRVAPPTMNEVLGEDLSRKVERVASDQLDADQLRRDARSARAKAGAARVEAAQARASGAATPGGDDDVLQREVQSADARLAKLQVRPLAVYEHPALLRHAIQEADQRVLIVSPWIRRAVVSDGFVRAVRKAIGRGVTFYVGYGLGESDDGEAEWDKAARLELERVAKESDRFILKRLGDTHAKVLIKDSDFFVISSFNWLSFRGNPHQTFREEWGTYVGVRDVVEEYANRMLERFR